MTSLTDDEITVLGAKFVGQTFITQTGEGLLPGQIVQLLGDHLDGKVILSLSTEKISKVKHYF